MVYHIFSEQNRAAEFLSKDIMEKDSAKVIFADAEEAQKNVAEEIRRIISEQCSDAQEIAVFLMAEEEQRNLQDGVQLLQMPEFSADARIRLYVFTSSDTARTVFDSLPSGKVQLTLVDPVETAVWNLLEEHPIYESADRAGADELRVLIIGRGAAIPRIIKSVYWCGRMRIFRMKMNMIGPEMDRIETELKLRCPGLFTQTMQENLAMRERGLVTPELYLPLRLTRAHYFPADTGTEDFEIALNECLNANYIIIDEGDDEATLRTAMAVRAHFIRKHVLHENFLTGGAVDVVKLPDIFVWIRNDALSDVVPMLTVEAHPAEPGHDALNLIPFGSMKSVYRKENVTENPLDILAAALFPKEFAGDDETKQREEACYVTGCMPPSIRRILRASALHLRYKLRDLNLVEAGRSPDIYNEEKYPELREASDRRTAEIQQNFKFEMTALEHQTWVVFRLADGWIPADAYHALGYGRLFEDGHREHRNFAGKMSAACVESSALSGTGTKMYGNPSYFTEYNRETAVRTCSALQVQNPELRFLELIKMDFDF